MFISQTDCSLSVAQDRTVQLEHRAGDWASDSPISKNRMGCFALDHQPAAFSLYLSKEPARKSPKLDEFSAISSIPVFHWPNTDGCCCTSIQPGDFGCPLLMHVIVEST